MPRAPIGPKAIREFIAQGPQLGAMLQAMTIEADAKDSYFWADLELTYSQNYDIDSGKSIGAEADAPALDGVVDVGANAGMSVEKSREGTLTNTQVMKFRSKAALTDQPAS